MAKNVILQDENNEELFPVPASPIEVTETEFYELADADSLLPNQWYKITNYAARLTNPYILYVQAKSTNDIYWWASAATIPGDTHFTGYASTEDNNPELWTLRVRYTNLQMNLDIADDRKYIKVIYMKDAWCNEAPFDFKQRWKTSYGSETFNHYVFSAMNPDDAFDYDASNAHYNSCRNNVISCEDGAGWRPIGRVLIRVSYTTNAGGINPGNLRCNKFIIPPAGSLVMDNNRTVADNVIGVRLNSELIIQGLNGNRYFTNNKIVDTEGKLVTYTGSDTTTSGNEIINSNLYLILGSNNSIVNSNINDSSPYSTGYGTIVQNSIIRNSIFRQYSDPAAPAGSINKSTISNSHIELVKDTSYTPDPLNILGSDILYSSITYNDAESGSYLTTKSINKSYLLSCSLTYVSAITNSSLINVQDSGYGYLSKTWYSGGGAYRTGHNITGSNIRDMNVMGCMYVVNSNINNFYIGRSDYNGGAYLPTKGIIIIRNSSLKHCYLYHRALSASTREVSFGIKDSDISDSTITYRGPGGAGLNITELDSGVNWGFGIAINASTIVASDFTYESRTTDYSNQGTAIKITDCVLRSSPVRIYAVAYTGVTATRPFICVAYLELDHCPITTRNTNVGDIMKGYGVMGSAGTYYQIVGCFKSSGVDTGTPLKRHMCYLPRVRISWTYNSQGSALVPTTLFGMLCDDPASIGITPAKMVYKYEGLTSASWNNYFTPIRKDNLDYIEKSLIVSRVSSIPSGATNYDWNCYGETNVGYIPTQNSQPRSDLTSWGMEDA